jgi:hypothetical protein
LRPEQNALVGRVAGKGLADEMKGAFYAVLEAPDGFAYHVQIDARTADRVREGDIVHFGTRPELAVRPDRRIAEAAQKTRGVYAVDPALDERERAQVVRRLGELEREGFVTKRDPNRWTVEKLESRPRTEPARERLWIQKLPLSLEQTPGHRGPVWLDNVERDALAGWGFGAEVRQAIERRRETLRALGIAPEDPRRDAKLREVERLAVGEGMAARTRQQFLAKAPDDFRGRLQIGPEGAPYAVVSDGTRFVLVPATRELRALSGKEVAVSRDAHGRLVVRGLDRGLER